MPRIDDQLLESVVYLYPSVEHAAGGEPVGGTGFFVSVDFESDQLRDRGVFLEHLYVVTASHVIRQGRSPVIRVNTADDRWAAVEADEADWYHHRDGDDLAVLPIGLTEDFHRFHAIKSTRWMKRENVGNYGPGDECFFIGRFITHEGRAQNQPTVRFGNIAMMPWEKVRTSRGIDQEAWLVESRSHSGYSGSPVFAYKLQSLEGIFRDPYSRASQDAAMGMPLWDAYLLGIDVGHLPYKRVFEPGTDEHWLDQNSGMMVVVPAWKLEDVLGEEELVKQRRGEEKKVEEDDKKHPPMVEDSESSEFERFERLTKNLVSVPKDEAKRKKDS